jgi:hypothetical protein
MSTEFKRLPEFSPMGWSTLVASVAAEEIAALGVKYDER